MLHDVWIAVLIVGILFLFGAIASALAAAGRGRTIAPILAGLTGLICLIAALALRPAPRAAGKVSPPVVASQPVASGGAETGSGDTAVTTCGRVTQSLGPQVGPAFSRTGVALPETLPGDVQHLPGTIGRLPGLASDLVPSPGFLRIDTRSTNTARILGYMMLDVGSAYYSIASGTDFPYTIQIEVGTPKPGACLQQLVFTALSAYDGGGVVYGIANVPAGQHLAAAQGIVACGRAAGDQVRTCAWAGTVGDHPYFGSFYGFLSFTGGQLGAFLDGLFAALTG
jgi:hypothetical protein